MMNTNIVTNDMVKQVLSGLSCAKVAKANNVSYNSLYSKVWTAKKNGGLSNVIEIHPVQKHVEETIEQIQAKLKERFAALDTMAIATLNGKNKSLIVSGPAGLGKSFGVMKAAEAFEKAGAKIAVVKGFVRPTGLYKVLFEHRNRGDVVIFDDADSVFQDDIALNLLKGACDMTKKRTLSWRAETKMETEDGEQMPTQFEFEGSIIFITNVDFDYNIAKGNNRAQHFQAMISRSIYLDLMMKTTRDYLVRIEQVAPDMFKMENVNAQQGEEILKFIRKEHNHLRELSLRMVLKLINLSRIDAQGWQALARTTCFKGKV
jgi:hypothetical protein